MVLRVSSVRQEHGHMLSFSLPVKLSHTSGNLTEPAVRQGGLINHNVLEQSPTSKHPVNVTIYTLTD